MKRKSYIGILALVILVLGCSDGESGTLMGRVVDGFGYPLGGEAVRVTLSGNPAVFSPDQYGNFIVRAPVGDYTMTISFTNPDAGFRYRLQDDVRIIQGSRELGKYTLLNSQNMDAWEAYRNTEYQQAIDLFSQQAVLARSGQLVWLPYMRYIEGEPGQNTLLTQGMLSAENGLGWCFSRGFGNHTEGKIHYEQSLAGGYNNYDAFVGLAGIAFGEGDGQAALDYLTKVIDEPGLYDTRQVHDNITETDLIVCRALAEFLTGQDRTARTTLEGIRNKVAAGGNNGSVDLMAALDMFL